MPRALVAAALLAACSSGKVERSGAPASAATRETPPAASPAPAPLVKETPAAAPAPVEPLGNQEGTELFETACTSCHTNGFVEGSRISEKGWNGEVAKMRKWGALVDEEQAAPFAAWLARKFPAAEAAPEAPTMSAASALATIRAHPDRGPRGDAERGKEVFARACASCHGAGALGTGGGPSLLENPVLRQGDRVALLVRKGQGRMPGFNDLKAEDVANLLAFLRGFSGSH